MSDRPNIVFIMPDQLRPDFLSCYGASFIATPHIDSLAAQGVRFTHAYSEHPVCVPARVSLLTGLHALKTGVLDNGLFLRPDHRACGMDTWPELLAEDGYYTAAIGKMHFYPWDLHLGFQRRVIAEDKRWIHIRDDYWQQLHRAGLHKFHGREHEGYFEHKGAMISRLPWEHAVDRFVGQEASRFVREHGKEGPFAMMVGFPGPHCPYDPTPEFLAGLDPEAMPPAIPENAADTPRLRANNVAGNLRPWNGVDYGEFTAEQKQRIRLHYAALVRQVDHEVGEILDALRETGQLDNTVIIFSSDHGDYLGDHNLIGKGHYFESSIHVPMIVRLPGATGPTVNTQLVTLTDVTGTILAVAGQPLAPYLDTRPLPDLGLPTTARDHILGALSDGWMWQDDRWRLSLYGTGEQTLYDLQEDPLEQHNRRYDPAVAAWLGDMLGALTSEIMTHQRAALHSQRVYVGDLSQMPAFGREGWQRPWPRSLANHQD